MRAVLTKLFYYRLRELFLPLKFANFKRYWSDLGLLDIEH